MSNISEYRKRIESNSFSSLQDVVKRLKKIFTIDATEADIDQCIQDISLPTLNKETLEVAYDFLKGMRTAVIKGKDACIKLQFNSIIQNGNELISDGTHISLNNLNEVLSHHFKVGALCRFINNPKGQNCLKVIDEAVPISMKILEKGSEFIQGLPGLVPSSKTVNSTMTLSQEALSRVKNLKDSTIVVDGKEFQVNVTILSLQSSFFLELFEQTEFKEDKENRFELKQEGVTQEAFEAYLTFVYERKIPEKRTMKVLASLYKLAHFLQDKDLMSALILKIYRKLDKKCFIEILQLALTMNNSGEDKRKEPSFLKENNQFLLDLVQEYLEMVPDAAIAFDPKKVDVHAKLGLLTVALNRDLLKDGEVREILLEKLIEERDEVFFTTICVLGMNNDVLRGFCKSYFTKHKDTIDPQSTLYQRYIAVLLSQAKSSTKKVVEKITAQKTV